MKKIKNQGLKLADNLLDFIYNSPTAFHAVKNLKNDLKKNNFKELKLRERWQIEKEGKYFTIMNDSAIIAFVVGKRDLAENGFRIIGTHTDSPTFRIKPSPEIETENYLKLNIEPYGGAIVNTWLDRPLSLAGRVSIKSEDILYPKIKLVNINKPLLTIPNLSIHMNRKVNEGIELNKQKDILPILSMIDEKFNKDRFLLKLISEEIAVKPEDIIDFDLFLYEYGKGNIVGLNDEFISSGRLDNLAMVHAGGKALLNSSVGNAINVLACFDNEEVGSRTKQGAASPLLKNILKRIAYSLGLDREDFFRAVYSSFMISADQAHAFHPNYPEKNDITNKPIINKGPVLKISANQNYITDSESLTVFEQICNNAHIPVQKFANRSDSRGGSTIGPISTTQLDMRSVDIGNPILAMHSIRETGGVLDHFYMTKAFEEFYK